MGRWDCPSCWELVVGCGHIMIGCGMLVVAVESDRGRFTSAGADQTCTRSQVDSVGSNATGVWCGEVELLS
jgi:hypothetical protein